MFYGAEAVADANKAIQLDQSMAKAYLRKGSVLGTFYVDCSLTCLVTCLSLFFVFGLLSSGPSCKFWDPMPILFINSWNLRKEKNKILVIDKIFPFVKILINI